MDLNAALFLLAREAGYLRTPVVCGHLGVTISQMLALRRQMLQQALGGSSLPALARRKGEPAPDPLPDGRK